MLKRRTILVGLAMVALTVVLAISVTVGYVVWDRSREDPFNEHDFMRMVEQGECFNWAFSLSTARLGERHPEVMQPLFSVLEGAVETEVRRSAMLALFYLRTFEDADTDPAVPVLLDIAADESGDEGVRRLAIFVLGNHLRDASSIVPVLTEILDSSADKGLHADAAMALGRFGPEARDAAPALGRAAFSTDVVIRARAVESIGAIGPDAAIAVPGLIAALDDDDPLIRTWAADALARIGPNAAPAVPALVQQLDMRRTWQPEPVREFEEKNLFLRAVHAPRPFRRPSCDVHAGMGMGEPRTLLKLAGWREAPPVLAARALAAIGPLAAEAIPALNAAANDPNSDVQYTARRALNAIAGQGG